MKPQKKDYLKEVQRFAKQAGINPDKIKKEREKLDLERRTATGSVQFF